MGKNRVLCMVMAGVLLVLSAAGCGVEKTATKKLQDLEYTLVEEKEIPEELMTAMEEKKEKGFKLTYSDKENLYIAIGYGTQDTGGYSISIEDCYLTKNAIYLNTTLIGPSKGEKINQVPSYPYIVIKMEYIDKSVVFQ